jgi:ribosomal protein L18
LYRKEYVRTRSINLAISRSYTFNQRILTSKLIFTANQQITMKFSIAVCALLASSAAAFAPAVNERSSTALNMDRRVAFGQIAAGAAVVAAMPQLAVADGSISAATINRSRVQYGGRIFDLKKAVDAGDFDAVAAEKSAFILFNSGAYPQIKNKPVKKAAIAGTNDIFAAIRAGDKAALKSTYTKYVADNGIKAFPTVGKDGQGYSGDFDYKVRSKAGVVYVR